MSIVRSAVRRIRGDDLVAMRTDVAHLREDVATIRDAVNHLGMVIGQLNHDVRSGAPEGLPLFVGYVDRLRVDAETAVGASVTIDRQLQRLGEQIDRLTAPDAGSYG
jgi:hypothetical protein